MGVTHLGQFQAQRLRTEPSQQFVPRMRADHQGGEREGVREMGESEREKERGRERERVGERDITRERMGGRERARERERLCVREREGGKAWRDLQRRVAVAPAIPLATGT